MKINFRAKFIKEATPVFVLKEKESVVQHPFFKNLTPEEKRQLEQFEKHSPLEGDFTHTVFLPSSRKVLLIGIKKFNHHQVVLAIRRVINAARREKIAKILINFDDFFNIFNIRKTNFFSIEISKETSNFLNTETLAEVLATQLEIANFEFVQYKEKPKDGWFFVKEVFVYADKKFVTPDIQKALARGKIIGEEINNSRILSNTPGGDMTPQRLAEAAVKVGRRTGFKTKILKENQLKKLKMGGIMGVARGSAEKPRFIIMNYFKGKKDEKPVVLVGKGVTFDTGGLNVKVENYMQDMHMDMTGGAAVIHTLAALARLGVKKNIVGLVPAVENMPSGSSYRPGDILRTISGKTIEVLNTDAEGRIILADALEYAKRYKPRLVIDIATLTGAALVALGQRLSALFATDPRIAKVLQDIGEVVNDFVWPFPLWEEYEEEIKSNFGDVANIGKTRFGGTITGAVFLWQFIKGYNWVHLDIAPRMTTIEGEFLAKGAAGAAVALLTNFLRIY